MANEPKDSVAAKASLKDDESPWPAFNDFTPSNLKRTASALIKEFEKSLTPPPERNDCQDSAQRLSFSTDKIISYNEARLLLSNLP